MIERQATSIKINPEIWAKAKHQAIDLKLTLGEYMEKLIKKEK